MGHSLINCGTQSASLCAHMHEHLISGSPALPLALLSILQIVSHVSESSGKKKKPGLIIPQHKRRRWAASTYLHLAFIVCYLLILEENGVILQQ